MSPLTSPGSWIGATLTGMALPKTSQHAPADSAEAWAGFAMALEEATAVPVALGEVATWTGAAMDAASDADTSDAAPDEGFAFTLPMALPTIAADDSTPSPSRTLGASVVSANDLAVDVHAPTTDGPHAVAPATATPTEGADRAAAATTPLPAASGTAEHEASAPTSTTVASAEPATAVMGMPPPAPAIDGDVDPARPAPIATGSAAVAPIQDASQPIASTEVHTNAADPLTLELDVANEGTGTRERTITGAGEFARPIDTRRATHAVEARPSAGPADLAAPAFAARPQTQVLVEALDALSDSRTVDTDESVDVTVDTAAPVTVARARSRTPEIRGVEMIARVRVRGPHPRTDTHHRSASLDRAHDLGARLRTAMEIPADVETTDSIDSVERPMIDAGAPNVAPPAPTVAAEDAAAGVTPSETQPSGTDERMTGVATTRTAPEPAPEVVMTRAPETPNPNAVADIGARLRAAIVETMAQQSRDELLASTREAWTATVTVEPASLGRVEIQVARADDGLRVTIVTQNQEAARALEAEVDDMADELVRRDLEPARITVRTGEGPTDSDRQSQRTWNDRDEAARRRAQDEAAGDEATERDGRGRRGGDDHEMQEQAR